ncbi:MAG: methyltransferase domain-containing protein [Vicinamibacterales bacterium]
MTMPATVRRLLSAVLLAALAMPVVPVRAQSTQGKPFEPTVGQAGKDVVWVPTPQPLVDKMLDMAKVGPNDLHYDLGSGDGRTVITAAKRGARSYGIEYNPDMVELSKRNAAAAKVSPDRATFVQADLFETDFSKANVVTLFLLPSINMRLRPKILDMAPGTRIVANTFTMEDWQADQTETVSADCVSWCTALLWIVPAKVAGTWQLGKDALTLTQSFQMLQGTLGSAAISDAKMTGADITFTAGGVKYTGKVDGNSMKGTTSSGAAFSATRK